MTLMWEVRAAPGRIDELVAYLLTHADPSAQIFQGAGDDPAQQDRVVLVDPSEQGVPGVPQELLARDPHEWTFQRVAR